MVKNALRGAKHEEIDALKNITEIPSTIEILQQQNTQLLLVSVQQA